MVFVQVKNADGTVDWRLQDSQEALLHSSQYTDMLQDNDRNEKYYEAIRHVVSKMQRLRCLDVGCGTGLLSLMVDKAYRESHPNVQECHVTALDLFEPMTDIARQVIADNGCSSITVLNKASTEMKEASSEKFNLCVSEIIDSALLGEAWLPSIVDAKNRLLTKDAVILPCRARLFVQPVSCADLRARRGKIGADLTSKWETVEVQWEECLHSNVGMNLGKPVVAGVYDMHTVTDDDLKESVTQFEIHFDVKSEWPFDGLLMWWELGLIEGVVISTEPGKMWREHWKQVLYLCPGSVNGSELKCTLTRGPVGVCIQSSQLGVISTKVSTVGIGKTLLVIDNVKLARNTATSNPKAKVLFHSRDASALRQVRKDAYELTNVACISSIEQLKDVTVCGSPCCISDLLTFVKVTSEFTCFENPRCTIKAQLVSFHHFARLAQPVQNICGDISLKVYNERVLSIGESHFVYSWRTGIPKLIDSFDKVSDIFTLAEVVFGNCYTIEPVSIDIDTTKANALSIWVEYPGATQLSECSIGVLQHGKFATKLIFDDTGVHLK